jgi:hypothetical protein
MKMHSNDVLTINYRAGQLRDAANLAYFTKHDANYDYYHQNFLEEARRMRDTLNALDLEGPQK